MAKPKKLLRWRKTCIRQWRVYRHFSLERAAEALSEPPYSLEYTHNSLGRVEQGKQMPVIELIEALAKLYDTDVDSLLNRVPEGAPTPSARGILQLWDRAEPAERGIIAEVVKRVVRTGT